MNDGSQIIPLLLQEEGVSYTPYLDSLGYPTIGVGFRIGPQATPITHYTFMLSDNAINIWLADEVARKQDTMLKNNEIASALRHCNQPRQDILISMAYQMGCAGLKNFHNMLSAIKNEDWNEAAKQMLNSSWAKQTRERALRHAAVIASGQWQPSYYFKPTM